MKIRKKKIVLTLTVIVLLAIVGCNAYIGIMNKISFRQNLCDINALADSTNPIFAFDPEPDMFNNDKPLNIPEYNPNNENPFQLDYRHADLSDLDLSTKSEALRHMMFDSETIWPRLLPQDFDPQAILEQGKEPGLGIKELHKNGIDGKGVSIAIIDANPLLLNHVEYKDNLKLYEEIHVGKDSPTGMHASAVASIAVGKNVGVAPGADLYYFTAAFWDYTLPFFGQDFTDNYTWMANAIERVLEINEKLPDEDKIKVVSISMGWSGGKKGYNKILSAINKAKEKNVFVISTSLDKTHNMNFAGLGRDIPTKADDYNSYTMGHFMSMPGERFKFFSEQIQSGTCLLVPMDNRTYAGSSGSTDYEYSPDGGFSWAVPYIAGLYALTLQVVPETTPEAFWAAALETGDSKSVTINDVTFDLGKIVNPSRLIERLSSQK